MRRYDPRLDPPPEGEWSCGDEATYLAYPDFCVGPSTIGPLVTQAFVDGIEGKLPLENAAKIEAGLTWFLYISVLKEAETCIEKPKIATPAGPTTPGVHSARSPLGLRRWFKK